MFTWIIVGLVAAFALGFPPLLVLVTGAFGMCGMAYVLTRDGRIAGLGFGLGLVLCNHILIATFQTGPSNFEIPSWVSWLGSDVLVGVVACIVICVSMILGIFGPIRSLPLDADGVIKMTKERQDKSGDAPRGD